MKTSDINNLVKTHNFVAIFSADGKFGRVYTADEKSVHSIAALCTANHGIPYNEVEKQHIQFFALKKSHPFWKSVKVINTATKYYEIWKLERVLGYITENDKVNVLPEELMFHHTYKNFALVALFKDGIKMVKADLNSVDLILKHALSLGYQISYRKVDSQDECALWVSHKMVKDLRYHHMLKHDFDAYQSKFPFVQYLVENKTSGETPLSGVLCESVKGKSFVLAGKDLQACIEHAREMLKHNPYYRFKFQKCIAFENYTGIQMPCVREKIKKASNKPLLFSCSASMWSDVMNHPCKKQEIRLPIELEPGIKLLNA